MRRRALKGGVLVVKVGSPNMQRYYRLSVQPDLFGCWGFRREWGRLPPGPRPRHRVLRYPTLGALLGDPDADALTRQSQRRASRGYVLP